MTTDQKIQSIISELQKKGITNKFVLAGILATIKKESNFVNARENLNYTSSSRLMQVYPSKFPTVASTLPYLNNPVGLGNLVYDNKGGNGANEGYFYRGGGYNGITFKILYNSIGNQIGENLGVNPDLLNNPEIASKANAQYFYNNFNSTAGLNKMKNVYGVNSINEVKDLNTAVMLAVNATAGWGTKIESLPANASWDYGLASAKKYAPDFLIVVESSSTDSKKKNNFISRYIFNNWGFSFYRF